MASQCPCCGSSVREYESLAFHETTSPEIIRELQWIDARRVALQRALNRVQPKIASLPTETLATIFEMLCPHIDLKAEYGLVSNSEESGANENAIEQQLILSAVCSHWRRIAISTPRLWTSLLVHANLTQRNFDVCSQYFINSSPLQMSLDIQQDFDIELNSILTALITKHASRIGELHIKELTPTLQRLVAHMPNLHQLIVQMDGTFPERSISIHSPLEYLMLGATVHHIPSIRYPTITVIHLDGTPVDIGLGLLMHSTNLIEFRFREIGDKTLETFQLPQEPFTLPHLARFEWESYGHGIDIDESMASFIRTPALRRLDWGEWPDGGRIGNARREFLRQLPNTLVMLNLVERGSGSWADDCVNDFFNHLPANSTIEDLGLNNIRPGSLLTIFEMLSPAHDSSIKLPKLKSITLYGTYIFDDDLRKFTLSMLKARCDHHRSLEVGNREEKSIVLVFKGPMEMASAWSEGEREMIKDLAILGAQVIPV